MSRITVGTVVARKNLLPPTVAINRKEEVGGNSPVPMSNLGLVVGTRGRILMGGSHHLIENHLIPSKVGAPTILSSPTPLLQPVWSILDPRMTNLFLVVLMIIRENVDEIIQYNLIFSALLFQVYENRPSVRKHHYLPQKHLLVPVEAGSWHSCCSLGACMYAEFTDCC